jgi:hypothetical protein
MPFPKPFSRQVLKLTFRRLSEAAPCAGLLTQGETRWGVSPASTMSSSVLVRALAASFVAGEPSVDAVAARLGLTLGKPWRWLRPLVRRYVRTFAGRTRPRQSEIIQFLFCDPGFRRAWSRYFDELSVAEWLNEPQRMQPAQVAATWDVPPIESVGALAEWLALEVDDLLWFADLKGLGPGSSVLNCDIITTASWRNHRATFA